MDKVKMMEYLASVDISGELAKRVSQLVDFFVDDLGINVSEVFVSEYLSDDGSREYESLWLLDDNIAMEAKQFALEDILDLAPMAHGIRRFEITKSNYDFKSAVKESKMAVYVSLITDISLNFRATGNNCDRLRDLIQKYLVPNIISDLASR